MCIYIYIYIYIYILGSNFNILSEVPCLEINSLKNSRNCTRLTLVISLLLANPMIKKRTLLVLKNPIAKIRRQRFTKF